MSGTRRRFAAAGLVAAVLVGIFLYGGIAGPSPLRPDTPATIAADWSPSGVVPVTFRARTWADGELVSLGDLLRGRALGLAVAGLAGVAAGALAWWSLSDAEGRVAGRRARARLPGRRAPPVAPA